jgi:hypothetical protein
MPLECRRLGGLQRTAPTGILLQFTGSEKERTKGSLGTRDEGEGRTSLWPPLPYPPSKTLCHSPLESSPRLATSPMHRP